MKVGDLVRYSAHHVRLGTHSLALVTGVGYSGTCPSTMRSPFSQPDIHVVTLDGISQVWNSKFVELLNESR